MSDGASGERPKPQYGEYATPEEQAARIRQPLPEAFQVPPAVPTGPAGWPADAPAERKGPAPATPGRIIDRAVAIALLAYGLLSLASAIPVALDPERLLAPVGLDAAELGVTTTGVWGILSVLVLAGGWLATAWATWGAHRRGWLLFWIPLAGGLLVNLIAGILLSFPLLANPDVTDAILRQVGG